MTAALVGALGALGAGVGVWVGRLPTVGPVRAVASELAGADPGPYPAAAQGAAPAGQRSGSGDLDRLPLLQDLASRLQGQRHMRLVTGGNA